MNINVDVEDGTMPHMALRYESEVINYWKGLMDYDEQITALKKAVSHTLFPSLDHILFLKIGH